MVKNNDFMAHLVREVYSQRKLIPERKTKNFKVQGYISKSNYPMAYNN